MSETGDTTGRGANGAQGRSVASADGIEADAIIAPPEKLARRRGRPRGQKKSGGRQKGTKNWTSEATREYFIENGKLLETLADLIAGRQMLTQPASGPGRVEWRYPPIELRAKTAVGIYNKCWPDFQVVDQTNRVATPPPADHRQISRAVILLLGSGVADATDTDSEGPSSSPAGRETLVSAAPAALRAVPGDVSGDEDSPSISPAAAAHISIGGPDSAGSYESGGSLDILKKSAPEKYKNQITGGQDDAAPELVGSRGHSILLREITGAGREKYSIHDGAGRHICSAWGRVEALRLCEELISTGRVSR